jgi:hypothetical protein
MPMFTIIALGPWRKILDKFRPLSLTEIEQCEGHCLEAMLHWQDPAERLKTLRCRCVRHTLADDNLAQAEARASCRSPAVSRLKPDALKAVQGASVSLPRSPNGRNPFARRSRGVRARSPRHRRQCHVAIKAERASSERHGFCAILVHRIWNSRRETASGEREPIRSQGRHRQTQPTPPPIYAGRSHARRDHAPLAPHSRRVREPAELLQP